MICSLRRRFGAALTAEGFGTRPPAHGTATLAGRAAPAFAAFGNGTVRIPASEKPDLIFTRPLYGGDDDHEWPRMGPGDE